MKKRTRMLSFLLSSVLIVSSASSMVALAENENDETNEKASVEQMLDAEEENEEQEVIQTEEDNGNVLEETESEEEDSKQKEIDEKKEHRLEMMTASNADKLSFKTADSIETGETKTYTFAGCDSKYLKFTPATAGMYSFATKVSEEKKYDYACDVNVYNENMENLYWCNLYGDENSSPDYFCNAGKTYYLKIEQYYDSWEGEMSFSVTKSSEDYFCFDKINVNGNSEIDEYDYIWLSKGDKLNISAHAVTSSEEEVTYKWYRYDEGWSDAGILDEEDEEIAQKYHDIHHSAADYTTTIDKVGEYTYHVEASLASGKTITKNFVINCELDCGEQYINGHKNDGYHFLKDENITMYYKAKKSNLTYQWYEKDYDIDPSDDAYEVDLKTFHKLEGQTKPKLSVKLKDSKLYVIEISDGEDQETYVFKVFANDFLCTEYVNGEEYSNDIEVAKDEKATLEVKIIGNSSGVTYQWYQEGDTSEEEAIEGATDATYVATKTTDDEWEFYSCRIYQNGKYVNNCSFCLYPKADHEHEWVKEDDYDSGSSCADRRYIPYSCTKCDRYYGEAIPPKGHTVNSYSIVKTATFFEDGLRTGECSVCGCDVEEVIPKLQPTIKVNATYIPLKVKQVTNAIRVSYVAGDGIASWTSSNLAIASVDANGKITGRKAGTAVITVTLKSGLKQNITVKVQKKAVATKSINVATKSVVLKKGQKISLGATVNPITSKQKLKYKSSKKKVATVSKGGIVTAKKAGKATITVTSGKKKVKVKVTVK